MENPFQAIYDDLREIKARLDSKPDAMSAPTPEIIDTDELCKRLDISLPTAIRYRKKGVIPFLSIGSAIRYNWPSVVMSLENKKGAKIKNAR